MDYTNFSKQSEEAAKEEVTKIQPKNPPVEEPEKQDDPVYADATTNVFIRDEVYGKKLKKEDFDFILSSKIIADEEGFAILPKKSRVEIYDTKKGDDGSTWYATRFGWMMGKNKKGKTYLKVIG